MKSEAIIKNLNAQIVAYKRQVKSSEARAVHAEKKAKKSEKVKGLGDLLSRIIENIQDVQIKNMTVRDHNNIDDALEDLIAAHKKVMS